MAGRQEGGIDHRFGWFLRVTRARAASMVGGRWGFWGSKYGEWGPMSKRRWFVVRTGCIRYWQKEEDVAAKVAAKGVIRVARVRLRSNGKGLALTRPREGPTTYSEDPAVTRVAMFKLIARKDGGREASGWRVREGEWRGGLGAVVEWLQNQAAERMSLSIEGRMGQCAWARRWRLLIETAQETLLRRGLRSPSRIHAGADTAAAGAGVGAVLWPVWAQERAPAWENVSGSHFVAKGGVLEKTEGGKDYTWDSGASSVQQIERRDGVEQGVVWKASRNDKTFIIGLSHEWTGTGWSDNDFGLGCSSDGYLCIVEKGSDVGYFGNMPRETSSKCCHRRCRQLPPQWSPASHVRTG